MLAGSWSKVGNKIFRITLWSSSLVQGKEQLSLRLAKVQVCFGDVVLDVWYGVLRQGDSIGKGKGRAYCLDSGVHFLGGRTSYAS